jgi:hypothetical protein
MLFTVDTDTLPANTLAPINAIINPQSVAVDSGITTPASGSRYLILDSIGSDVAVWGGLSANANDIIEYNGSSWSVVLDSASHSQLEYVTNLTTTVQYKWSNGAWTKSVEGVYREGEWSIIL